MSEQPKNEKPRSRALTRKQERFVAEYLVDFNATAAAVRAGYSSRTADAIGYENLRKPGIQARVQATVQRHLDTLDLSLERIVQEAARVGISDIRALVDRHGRLRPISELSADAAAAVSSVRVTSRSLGDGTTEMVSEYKLWPKLKALEFVAKLRGLLGQKVTEETGESWADVLIRMSAEDEQRAVGPDQHDCEDMVSAPVGGAVRDR